MGRETFKMDLFDPLKLMSCLDPVSVFGDEVAKNVLILRCLRWLVVQQLLNIK